MQRKSPLTVLAAAVLLAVTVNQLPAPNCPGGCQILFQPAFTHVTIFSTTEESGGVIDNAGVANSLEHTLEAALTAAMAGRFGASVNELRAFTNEVNAQAGQHINLEAASVLTDDAETII